MTRGLGVLLAVAAAGFWLVCAASPAAAETVRCGLLGSSYMAAVELALQQVGLSCQQLEASQLVSADPESLDVLFVAHDVLGAEASTGADSALVSWLAAFRLRGGVVCTFFSVPPSVQRLLGFQQGAYLRQQYDGQFASIRSTGAVAGLPAAMAQQSRNIIPAVPLGDSVRVVARWYDRQGQDTGQPALLLGPGSIHLTHVLLGEDLDAAAQMYVALLGQCRAPLWPQAAAGALQVAFAGAGGREELAAQARGSRAAAKVLQQADLAVAEGERRWRQGDHEGAVQAAFRARRLAAEALAAAQPSRPHEFRAVWIHSPFGVGEWGWERSLATLAEAGFNAIIPNMLDAGVTSYPSDVLPADPRVATAGDQMAAVVQAAHRHGLEVHAWKVNYNLSGADSAFVQRLRREGRLQLDTAGREVAWLCPSHPDNVALEAASLLEVVRNYPVDGIHFDYIRYPGVESCYCAGCRRRFEEDTGHYVHAWPEDVLTGELLGPFQRWRQDQVTELVRAVAIQARQIRPEIRISAAVFPNWPESRYTEGQDWIRWVEEGYLDFVCPMDYLPDMEAFAQRVQDQVRWVDGRVPLYIGIGSWQMGDPAAVLRQIAFTRQAGADGFVLFEYNAALAERVFPLLRRGLTSAPAQPPHVGPVPHLVVAGQTGGQVLAGAAYYRADTPVELTAQLVGSALHPSATGRLTWETVDGRPVRAVATLHSAAGRVHRDAGALPPGDYRPAVDGTYRDARGREHRFARRGPVVQVRPAAFMDSLARQEGPPAVPGAGVPVAVFADGYGAASVAAVLAAEDAYSVFQVRALTDPILAASRVLIVPQPYNRWRIDRAARQRLRAWVQDGGALLVTHDMVGIRGAQPIVPEVCRRGTGYPRSVRWQVCAPHAAVAGVPAGLQPHSYYDHVTVEPGPDGQVVAVDDEGRPVLVVGTFGQGRFAALGLVPGLGPGDVEVAPVDAERALVTALVRWLAER